jgi:hypothetical protein
VQKETTPEPLADATKDAAPPENPFKNVDFAKEEIKTLEQAVELHLLTLNRHERRAWLANRSRVAGKQRKKALTQ